jgi:hypothetical protein
MPQALSARIASNIKPVVRIPFLPREACST